MGKRILLIQGHPDPCPNHLCHTLADAYASGAIAAGHELRTITVAQLDFPLLRNEQEWAHGPLPACLRTAQDDIFWAQHLVVFFPLWMGDMPALFKGFLEQVARPGFAFASDKLLTKKPLAGRTARVVVTMGMPVLRYRLYFLNRNVLSFVGIRPVRHTLIGMAAHAAPDVVVDWTGKLQDMGREGS